MYSNWQQRHISINGFSDGRCWLNVHKKLKYPTFTVPILSNGGKCWETVRLGDSVYLELHKKNLWFQIEFENLPDAQRVLLMLSW
jgi:hypothetical protein